MATNTKQFKIDATRPLYAVVGAGDLVVEFARSTAADVQTRVAKADIEPKVLRDQARTLVAAGVDEATDTYGDLAARGKDLVNRIRKQQATQDAKAAAGTTTAKAKTTKTQTAKSAQQSGATAKRSAKATGTAARKTASASTKAASDAADKVGD